MFDQDHPATIDAPLPDDLRGFFHPKRTREWVLNTARDLYQKKLNSLESKNYKLQVDDVDYVDPNKHFTLKDQQDAILNKEDIALPLKGKFKLIDKNTGQVVDEKHTTIARIPWVTPQNTVILNGGSYIQNSQERLRPGVYTRVQSTGNPEAHINVLAGTGLGGRIEFDPAKALFTLHIGSTKIKLYGILHDLGVSDTQLEKHWGKEILLKNKAQYDGNEVIKYHGKIFNR